jgi:hypothetical protein
VNIRVETNASGLGSLYLRLVDLPRDVQRDVVKDGAEKLQARVDSQFARGVDPYGVAWPRPKAGNPPGDLTGNLKGKARVIGRGTRIIMSAAGVTYAGFFARRAPIFPEQSIGLPPAWKSDLDAIALRSARRRLGAR